MKKILLATTALFALGAAAQAADLGAPRMPMAAAVVAPVFTWSGFYVGGQVGGAWMPNRTTEYVTATGIPTGTAYSYTPGGIIGGVHAGFNWQMNSLVLGLEADIEASGVRGSFNFPNGDGSSFRSNWQGSVRARLGYAADRALFYVTGGLAFADMRHSYYTAAVIESFSQTRTGWTLGAGVEYAFTPNWTARVEYRYSDFGRSNYASAVAFPGFSYQQRPQEHAVRVGVSYLFSTGPSAVVARY